jgi:hypothetical protein
MTAAASQMFMFYSNLLSPKSKYSWNKIVSEQTESHPFVNLQGVTLESPRGMSRELFNNCIMFHLLTAFPINAAEQEKYFILNVLKKPQRINVRHLVHRVLEQLNAYIPQMPCFYYSPNINASTKPKNVPFTEAELGAHVLRMCPIQWQDQYNMNKKGMTPMDMHLLLTSLEVIKRICTTRKGRSALLPILWPGFPRKSDLRRTVTCARSMGACIPHTTLAIVVGLKRMGRRDPISAPLRKAEREAIP